MEIAIVDVKELNIKEFTKTVLDLYKQEPEEFFTKYHKRGGSLHECVVDTLDSTSRTSKPFLVINEDQETVGYFVKAVTGGHYVLEGFHIAKKFRTPEWFEEFWKLVRLGFDAPFYTGIYKENKPAIRHLLKNGFEKVGEMGSKGKQFVLFISK